MKKGFAHIEILFVFLAIFVLGITAFVVNRNSTLVSSVSPTSQTIEWDGMDGWESYESDKYEFSFKYPRDWFFYRSTEEGAIVGTHTLQNVDSLEIERHQDHGVVGFESLGKSVFKIEIGFGEIPVDFSNLNLIKDELMIGNTETLVYTTDNIDKTQHRRILVPKTSTNYNFRIGIYGNNLPDDFEQSDEYQKVKQILSTFEFVGSQKAYITHKLVLLDFPQISFSYPDSWTLADESNSDLSYTNVTLTKGKHTIHLLQDAWDGAACIFSDAQMLDGPVSDLRDIEFKQIETQIGTLRYFSEGNPDEAAVGNNLYKFCKKGEDGIYASPIYPASIGFETPEDTSVEIFSEMEEIVKSIKVIE